MAGYGAFQFSSPSEYGDWAQYAGLNRRTGEIEESRLASAVKPPENFQQYLGQRLAGSEAKLAAVAPAMQQMAQGNFFQAVGTMQNAKPGVVTPQATQAPVVDTGYDYTFGL